MHTRNTVCTRRRSSPAPRPPLAWGAAQAFAQNTTNLSYGDDAVTLGGAQIPNADCAVRGAAVGGRRQGLQHGTMRRGWQANIPEIRFRINAEFQHCASCPVRT